MLKTGSNCSNDQHAFSYGNASTKQFTVTTAKQAKIRASNDIIESILKLVTRKKSLALHCVLANPHLIKEASDCSYFWKDIERIYTALELLDNQN